MPSSPTRLLLLLPFLAACAAIREVPRPGAAGLGDPYYPMLGNGGYDVAHYDLELSVDVEANRIEATCTIDAVATHALSAFHLDFEGLEIGALRVDGRAAGFRRDGSELVVVPDHAIGRGEEFRVEVEYSGEPARVADPGVPFVPGVGWMHTESGIYVMSEVVGAQGWYPVNNHPLDKATWSIRATVPKPYVAASNGLFVGETDHGDTRTFAFRASDPMASYLTTLCIAEFDVLVLEGPGGMAMRHYLPPDATEKEREAFARTGEMIELYSELFGPYPFETFGGILAHGMLGGALETQTIPVYSRGISEGVIAHELAHQWFGDSLSPAGWNDLWLSEGFATYASWLWRERNEGPAALEERARRGYRRARSLGPPGDTGPVVFNFSVYARGAWALHALRREIGDEAFFGTLRAFTGRFRHGTVTTASFRAVAEEQSGRDLEAFFEAWVFGPEMPVVAEMEEGDGGDGDPSPGGG